MDKKSNSSVTEMEESSELAAAEKNVDKRNALEVTEEARDKGPALQSFAAQLLMGDFAWDMIHPFPTYAEKEQEKVDQFIDKLTELLKQHLDPDEVDQTGELPKPMIEAMGRLGVFAMKIPREYGGLGFSQSSYNRVVMKVASYCANTAVLISAHQSIGVPQPLKMFGTEAQKKKYFPRFCQGEISAFALTETEVGSDPARMSMEAKLSDDGQFYILNGEKLWCTNGPIANVIVVVAKTAPKIVDGREKKQISAFIVEMNLPGVKVVHRCRFMGLSAIYNGLLRFENVKVPVENLLASEGRGLAMALATINIGRLTLPAACIGAAKQALKIARKWGEERVQWGMPVGRHEAGRSKIAYIAATTLAMEALSFITGQWCDRGDVDLRIEGAMAKLFCTESLWKIIDQLMQLRGGRGYEKATSLKARGEPGYPVERMMRDSRINTILEGSTEIMHLFLAREALDPHLKRAMGLLSRKSSVGDKLQTFGKLIGFYSLWYPKQLFKSLWGKSFSQLGELTKHVAFAEKCCHRLARTIFSSILRYRQKLETHQQHLARLMEIGTELFAISAVCSYAIHLQQKQNGDETPVALADYFCCMARRRIENLENQLKHNDDRKANALAETVLEKRCLWLEEGIFDGP